MEVNAALLSDNGMLLHRIPQADLLRST
jgi:hypothetical protein